MIKSSVVYRRRLPRCGALLGSSATSWQLAIIGCGNAKE
jgi:hypothetical protein